MKFTRLAGALVAVALPFAVSGVAGAAKATSLTLTIATPEGDPKSVRLTCGPPDGSHPAAARACAELQAAQGDFDELRGAADATPCTMEYLPVTASAEGTWRGEAVTWKKEFGNACSLRTATGTVFLF
jgi:Subtilisin inhibitor-like